MQLVARAPLTISRRGSRNTKAVTSGRHVGASLWTARLYRLCGHEPGAILDTDTGLAAAAELRELRDIVAGIMFGARP